MIPGTDKTIAVEPAAESFNRPADGGSVILQHGLDHTWSPYPHCRAIIIQIGDEHLYRIDAQEHPWVVSQMAGWIISVNPQYDGLTRHLRFETGKRFRPEGKHGEFLLHTNDGGTPLRIDPEGQAWAHGQAIGRTAIPAAISEWLRRGLEGA